jgi:hypothetical protein
MSASRKRIGRNQICPCGSGRKYKRCHGGISDQNASYKTTSGDPRTILDKLEAAEHIRRNQQGLGRPVIAAKVGPVQMVAVGATIYWSDKWKTFPDFLSDYLKRLLGSEWGNEELAKPLEQRHPILQWYDSYCRYQQATIQREGEVATVTITGVVACYLGLAYSLYLLQHNVEIQNRLVARLKHPGQFQGAYYELIIANILLRSGFKLTLEDEADGNAKHCEFAAISTTTGQRYWVEAKMKGVVGLLGKTAGDGSADPNPISSLVPHLNQALAKPAADKRLIFIDLNAEVDRVKQDKPAWVERAAKRLELYEMRELSSGVEAYLFVTNMAYHRQLDVAPIVAALPYGLGIPDLNKPGLKRLSQAYLEKQKHIDAHRIGEAFTKYMQLPQTFDGTLPTEAFGENNRRIIIGETYHFDDGKGGTIVGTVTTAAVSQVDSNMMIGIRTPTGEGGILTRTMTSAEIEDYRSNPEAYFGKLLPVGGNATTPFELHEWFTEAYKGLPRETLLERLAGSPEFERLKSTSNDELLAVYCEGLVASADTRGSASGSALASPNDDASFPRD